MGFFSKSKNEGVMDVIRCDLPSYLVWKWRPSGSGVNTTIRENSIRWGSSIRVKEGEMAIFVYKQKEGQYQDVITGPYDQTLKTANLPVLSKIIGLAYNGNTPFQAEVYFINLANNIQILFGVPYFDVFDPRYMDLAVPVSVRGALTFNIADYQEFIKNNRLINFDLEDLKKQIKSAISKYVKNVIIPLPQQEGFSLMQIESKVLAINERIEQYVAPRLRNDFGLNLRAMDIEAIEVNKDSEGYKDLKKLTIDIQKATTLSQSELNIRNMYDSQEINKENMRESLRIQREEAQRAQRLQTEQANMAAHSLDQQTSVMHAAAQAMGNMNGNVNLGGSSSGFNPAGMMTGMMMGGALGQQMAGMMNNVGQSMNSAIQQTASTPPPIPNVQYYVLTNGQQQGPFPMQTLSSMATNHTLTPDTYVWKNGMANWDLARNTELSSLFAETQAAPPPIPPVQ